MDDAAKDQEEVLGFLSDPASYETEKLPEAAYAPEVTARVYGAIANKALRIFAADHSAIVDAAFAKPQERDALAAAAEAAKVPLQGSFSLPIWRPESPALAAARRTPPTPMPRWSRPRKATTSAR